MRMKARKLLIVQRILPQYRAPFFERVAQESCSRVVVAHGKPMRSEGVRVASDTSFARAELSNKYFGNRSHYLCWQAGLANVCEKEQPDIVVMEANARLLSHWSTIRKIKSRGRPVVCWGLGTVNQHPHRLTDHARWQLLNRFYRSFDVLIAYSSKGAKDYESFGIDSSRIFVAPNSVSTDLARDIHSLPGTTRKVQDNSGAPRVLFVGRLIAEKKVDDLLTACSQCPSQPELLIVGDGPDRERLQATAKSTYPTAKFVGHKTGRELRELFRSASLFVLPGSGGIAVQETVAFGLPVVVGAGDGTEIDLVVNGSNGFLFNSGDIDAMSQHIEEICSHRELRDRMARASMAVAAKRSNIDIMIRGFNDALQAALRLGGR